MGVYGEEGFREKPVVHTQRDEWDSPEKSVVDIINGQYYHSLLKLTTQPLRRTSGRLRISQLFRISSTPTRVLGSPADRQSRRLQKPLPKLFSPKILIRVST